MSWSDSLSSAWDGAVSSVSQAAGDAASGLAQGASDAWNGAVQGATSAWSGVAQGAQSVAGGLAQAGGDLASGAQQAWADASAGEGTGALVGGVADLAGGAYQYATDAGYRDGVNGAVSGGLTQAWNDPLGTLGAVGDGLGNAADAVWQGGAQAYLNGNLAEYLGQGVGLAAPLVAGAVFAPEADAAEAAGLLGDAGLATEDAAAATRGLNDLGGILSPQANAAGGQVWTATGPITQNDLGSAVTGGLYQGNGEVNIISGVHGFPDGSVQPEPDFFAQDQARFGNVPGVTVHDYTQLSPERLDGLVNGPGTTIGAFCDSGACLPPVNAP